jgi:hypothetical protein
MELVLLAIGEAESNREKAEHHGLESVIPLQSGLDIDAFQ